MNSETFILAPLAWLAAVSLAVGAEPPAPAKASGGPSPASTNQTVVATAGTNAAPVRDFASFKIISDRNIFNPNRTARSARTGESEKPRVPKVEFFSLLGVLSYSSNTVAYFDGSSSSFRQSLKTNETIAGHTLLVIKPSLVTLSLQGTNVTLPVGGQMKRTDEGPWESAAGAAKAVASAGSTSTAGDASSTSPSSGGADDVLARLLKKREQEQKNEKQ